MDDKHAVKPGEAERERTIVSEVGRPVDTAVSLSAVIGRRQGPGRRGVTRTDPVLLPRGRSCVPDIPAPRWSLPRDMSHYS